MGKTRARAPCRPASLNAELSAALATGSGAPPARSSALGPMMPGRNTSAATARHTQSPPNATDPPQYRQPRDVLRGGEVEETGAMPWPPVRTSAGPEGRDYA